MQSGNPIGLLLALTYNFIELVPPGDGVESVVWVPGNEPTSGTHSVGGSVGVATFSPGSIGLATFVAGDDVDSAVWIPGDQV